MRRVLHACDLDVLNLGRHIFHILMLQVDILGVAPLEPMEPRWHFIAYSDPLTMHQMIGERLLMLTINRELEDAIGSLLMNKRCVGSILELNGPLKKERVFV